MSITPKAQKDLELILKDEGSVATTCMVNASDLRNTMTDGVINSAIIYAFLQQSSSNQKSVLCVNSFVFPYLLTRQTERAALKAILRRDDLSSFKVVIVPIHLQGTEVDNFGVVAIYPHISLMVYADSGPNISDMNKTKVFATGLSLVKAFYKNIQPESFVTKWKQHFIAGLSGRLNEGQLCVSVREMANIAEIPRKRKDLDETHTINNKKAVQSVIETMQNMINPFDYDVDSLVAARQVNFTAKIFKGSEFAEEFLPPNQDCLDLHLQRANYQWLQHQT
eukprot:gene4060-4612_t